MMPGVVVPDPALSRAAAENQTSQARADNQASQAGANPPAHEWRLQNSEQTHLLHGRTGARGSSVAAHSVRHGMHSPTCHSERSEESVPPAAGLPDCDLAGFACGKLHSFRMLAGRLPALRRTQTPGSGAQCAPRGAPNAFPLRGRLGDGDGRYGLPRQFANWLAMTRGRLNRYSLSTNKIGPRSRRESEGRVICMKQRRLFLFPVGRGGKIIRCYLKFG